MHDSQLEVLKGCLDCLQKGERVTLVSVAQTWGTSPRPVGALLAVNDTGRFYGSVSGGCVEEDLIERLTQQPPDCPEIFLYGETQEERHHFGLPCGGVLQLVAEPLNDKTALQNLIRDIEQRKTFSRTLDLKNGEVTYQDLTLSPSESSNTVAKQQRHLPQLTEIHWRNIFGPVWQLVIVGAGETGKYLAEMGLTLGYKVTVLDSRPDYQKNWDRPNIPLIADFPDDALVNMLIDQRTAIVTVAHDPRVDDMALLQALNSDAFYVGALGSRVNNQQRRERLVEHFGFTVEQVNKLKGPVGLPIGSKTPPEIALAILSEITALKNGVDLKARLQNASAHTETASEALASSPAKVCGDTSICHLK